MNREQTRAALSGALDRWHELAEDPDSSGSDVAASFEHIEVFALASLAQELAAISATMQARHEEAIDRGAERGGQARRRDLPCREIRRPEADAGTGTGFCTRPLGHAGEHVDATGERWGGEHG